MRKIWVIIIIIIIAIFGINIRNNKNNDISEKKENANSSETMNLDEQKYIDTIQNNGYSVNYAPEKKPEYEYIQTYHVATKGDVEIIYEEIKSENVKQELIYDGNDENVINMIKDVAVNEEKQNEANVKMYYECAKTDSQKNAVKKVENEEYGPNWTKYTFETNSTYACVLNVNNIIITFKDNYINSNEEMQNIKKEFENIINSFYK